MKLKREYLIKSLQELLSDEFNTNELIYKSKKELILFIIELAYYYKNESR